MENNKQKYMLKSDHAIGRINDLGQVEYLTYRAGDTIELSDSEALGLQNKIKKYVMQADVPKMNTAELREYELHHVIVVPESKPAPKAEAKPNK